MPYNDNDIYHDNDEPKLLLSTEKKPTKWNVILPLLALAVIVHIILFYVYFQHNKANTIFITSSENTSETSNNINSTTNSNNNILNENINHATTLNSKNTVANTAKHSIPAIIEKSSNDLRASESPEHTNMIDETHGSSSNLLVNTDEQPITLPPLNINGKNNDIEFNQLATMSNQNTESNPDSNKEGINSQADNTQILLSSEDTDVDANPETTEEVKTDGNTSSKPVHAISQKTIKVAKKSMQPTRNNQANRRVRSASTHKKTQQTKTEVSLPVDYSKAIKITETKQVVNKPTPTQQDLKDAKLLNVDLAETEHNRVKKIVNQSSTNYTPPQYTTNKTNPVGLNEMLSSNIQAIKSQNQYQIDRDRQLAEQAYRNRQQIEQMKQNQVIDKKIEHTETQLEKSFNIENH